MAAGWTMHRWPRCWPWTSNSTRRAWLAGWIVTGAERSIRSCKCHVTLWHSVFRLVSAVNPMRMLLLSSCLFVGGLAHAANDLPGGGIDPQALSRHVRILASD